MSKERLRLKEFRNYIDFLDDSVDAQDNGRFVDTLHSLYEDGWFDWIYLYAKEQAERVQELEKKIRVDSELFEKQVQINKRYREAMQRAMNEGKHRYGDSTINKIYTILEKAIVLEGER